MNKLSILRGAGCKVDGIGTIRPVTLGEIESLGDIGNKYYASLFFLVLDKARIAKEIDVELDTDAPLLHVYLSAPPLRKMLLDSLSFFLVERLSPQDDKILLADTGGNIVGVLDSQSFPRFQRALKVCCCLEAEEEDAPKFSGEKAKKIWEKCRDGRKRLNEAKGGPAMDEIISCVSALSGAYNLLNIWDLTVYQLLDQFRRLYGNAQFHVFSTRWAAWGQKDFDFSAWHK